MSESIPSTFHLKIVTPRKLLCDVEAESASLPTLEGLIGILPGHRPLYVAVGEGLMTYRADREEVSHRIKGGFARIRPDDVVVMTEMSEHEQKRSPEGQG